MAYLIPSLTLCYLERDKKRSELKKEIRDKLMPINRRYNLSTLVPDDYPKITKVINAMLSHDESIKKYL